LPGNKIIKHISFKTSNIYIFITNLEMHIKPINQSINLYVVKLSKGKNCTTYVNKHFKENEFIVITCPKVTNILNKAVGKVYSLEYTEIPKVFFTPHQGL
jgi:hypothetical protein